MKKSLFYCLFLSVSIGFFSCSTKSSSTPSGTFTASVNGSSFVANSVVSSDLAGAFLITGTTAAGQEISISIPNLTSSTSSYTIDSLYHQAFYYASTNTTPTTAKSGSFTINFTGSNSATGTFSFVCKDGTNVTGGTYSTNWQ